MAALVAVMIDVKLYTFNTLGVDSLGRQLPPKRDKTGNVLRLIVCVGLAANYAECRLKVPPLLTFFTA